MLHLETYHRVMLLRLQVVIPIYQSCEESPHSYW